MVKKLIVTLLLLAGMSLGYALSAQVRFGVVGGFTSSSAKARDIETSSVNQYHLGVGLKVPLVAGLVLQPQVVYHVKGVALGDVKGSTVDEILSATDMKVGYLEIPVQLQWGIDLLGLRPYVLAEPFLGVGIDAKADKKHSKNNVNGFGDTNLSRWEYGLGMGFGIDLLDRIQISLKYFWNFGNINEDGTVKSNAQDYKKAVADAFDDKQSFNGIMVTAGIFF